MDEQSDQGLQAPPAGPLSGPSFTGSGAPVLQAHGVKIDNGHFVQAGGNVNIQQYCYNNYLETKPSIISVLRLVNNLRNIHLDILSKVTPGTGIWLFATDKFILWMDPNGNLKILWGNGIRAGKSVMASIVINELEARARAAGGSICVCYIYFRYSDVAFTIRDILEILVKQTIERHPECALLAEEAYAQHLKEDTQPTEAELLRLLQRFTGAKSVTFYVLDALDEALDKLQLELIKKLASLNVRLFITSRPLQGVEDCLSGVHSIPILAQAQDIELHIMKGIDDSPNLQGVLRKAGASLREEIVTSIKQNCNGMFLHASLQLNALSECISPGQVRRTLEAFPSNIESVYLQTWDRVLKRNPGRISLAKTVLLWVLYAVKSLTIEQLEKAVAASPETYRCEHDEVVTGMSLTTLCCGLVTFEEESGLVRLVHYTAKRTLQELLQESFPHPHSHLATVCMTHLEESGFQNTMIRSIEGFTAALQADPLLAYASDAWATHARESLDVEDTRRRSTNFIGKSSAYPLILDPALAGWFDILRPLHIVIVHNLPISFINNGDIGDPNVATQIDQASPLILASVLRREEIVKLLLACAEIQVNGVQKHGFTALILAASRGHEVIIKLLLGHPEIQVNLDGGIGSALVTAACLGRQGSVALLLARPEIQVNLVDEDGSTALMYAAYFGYNGIVQLLLSHPEIRVNMVDKEGLSAVMLAARKGHKTTVTLLLAHSEIQVNLFAHKGWSALIRAAYDDCEGVVVSLLAHPEIQVNLVDDDGSSALMKAAAYGYEGVAKQLLARPEIQVNLVNITGWSALMLAASSGHEGTVRLLVAQHEIRNVVNNAESSGPLSATENDDNGAVTILVARSEIQVNLVDNEGWSALILAASSGYVGIVKLLLAFPDIQVNLVNNEGWSALMLAAIKGHKAVIKLLLAHPKTLVNLTDNEGWSALMRAARHGREEAVTLFIAHPETLVNLVSNQGFSALMLAVNWGHEAIVRLLLDIPHLNTTTSSVKYGRTAMSIALDNGHTAIIQLLEEFELRQAQSDSELEEEVGTRYDSDSSGSYQDAEEWLERDDIVPP